MFDSGIVGFLFFVFFSNSFLNYHHCSSILQLANVSIQWYFFRICSSCHRRNNEPMSAHLFKCPTSKSILGSFVYLFLVFIEIFIKEKGESLVFLFP